MVMQEAAQKNYNSLYVKSSVQDVDEPIQAAETILRRFGARAISILTTPRQTEDGKTMPARLSANDCYVTLEEACRKMARVALRKYQSELRFQSTSYSQALEEIFPDPAAYLTRCIRSVVSDAERLNRREVPTVSMDQPLAGVSGESCLLLRDTIADTDIYGQPEERLIDNDERVQFRLALANALRSIPKNYLEAIQRDMAREAQRQDGVRVAPETDRERQTVCRARAALATILKRECSPDNPFVRLLAQQRSSRVRHKSTQSQNWTAERQKDLFKKLLNTPWSERVSQVGNLEDNIEEAVVNEVSAGMNAAPPSPEMRVTMRVLDLFVLDNAPMSLIPESQKLYVEARIARKAGKLEEALSLYRTAFELDPQFLAASNEVGVLLMQTGNLREALKVYLSIIERADAGEQKYIAANNAADVYLTWFDAGRNRECNIERASNFAKMAMECPTPMRACNLMLAYIKDRYYVEAKTLLESLLRENSQVCPGEKFLHTLFQIRDSDLVTWWNWLDSEMEKEPRNT